MACNRTTSAFCRNLKQSWATISSANNNSAQAIGNTIGATLGNSIPQLKDLDNRLDDNFETIVRTLEGIKEPRVADAALGKKK